MSIEPEGKESRAGFAGMASMASEVDFDVARARQARANSPRGDSPQINAMAPEVPVRGASATSTASAQPSRNAQGSDTKWLWGIGITFGMVWLLSLSRPNDAPVAPRPNGPPMQSKPQITQNANRVAPVSQPNESLPPQGTNNILSYAQLKYCLAEDVRLNAANGVLDPDSHLDIDRYNAMIADYNSRCGRFRYRKADLAGARAEIEANRGPLERQGISRFVRGK